MVNQQNLKPYRSVDEARSAGQRGGKASGEARRKKKTLQDALVTLMGTKISEQDHTYLGIDPSKKVTYYQALAAQMLHEALYGDDGRPNVRAAEFVRDTIGEKPVAKVEAETTVSISEADMSLINKVGARLDAASNC